MEKKIEGVIRQLVDLGIPEEQARRIIREILEAPPTDAEIEDALRDAFRARRDDRDTER